MQLKYFWFKITIVIFLALLLLSCQKKIQISAENISIEFNQFLHSRIAAHFDNTDFILSDFAPSETIVVSGQAISDFTFKRRTQEKIDDNIGTGIQYILTGKSRTLKKEITVHLYDDFPSMAVYKVKYTNISDSNIQLDSYTNHAYRVDARDQGKDWPSFWSFQSGSYEDRRDWVLPLKEGFEQQNYMGMNATDYGGGTPLVDVWRPDVGLGVGHVEMAPKLISLPVRMLNKKQVQLSVTHEIKAELKPNEHYETLITFVTVHQGDYFHTLAEYRRFMIKQGVKFDQPPETVYEPIWCAWGYEREFTMEQVYNTLPKVRELGFKWAVLDDGYQTAEGDWYLLKNKFPRGDSDMQKFVDNIHAAGLQAKLWWAPLAVDPGTDLIKDHPDYLSLNEDGSKQKISWWNAYYLCPAHPEVQTYTKNLVEKIMKTWGYDGLKIDGQHLNAAPPCYNAAHNHAYPEEAFEKVPEFFKVIYETALSIKPNAVVEICPCGTAYAFHTMPFMNQPVSSDPESSWQIRLKGKTLKALMGPTVAYYGDHVELSDNRMDFASTVGIGGVIGTKFTWPVGSKKESKIDLTPEKEKMWKKWIDIYVDKMLPKGRYLGTLYDIGYDKPEAHVVKKDGNMYYAFYADSWQGTIELRGLDATSYKILDYINQKEYGTIQGPVATLNVEFDKYLLLEVIPK
jgi:alpha-galactosidase